MNITAAKYDNGRLILDTTDTDARRFAYNFKPGEYQIAKAKQPRSLAANAYCWALCDQIARAVGETKENIYRRNIRDCGVYSPLPIKAEAVADFIRIWSSHGVGWFADVIDDSKLPGYKLLFAYHGSSVYTVPEMARLIDKIIQDAKSVGIDVISESDRALLLEDWGKR